jgi:hypothetical protein
MNTLEQRLAAAADTAASLNAQLSELNELREARQESATIRVEQTIERDRAAAR